MLDFTSHLSRRSEANSFVHFAFVDCWYINSNKKFSVFHSLAPVAGCEDRLGSRPVSTNCGRVSDCISFAAYDGFGHSFVLWLNLNDYVWRALPFKSTFLDQILGVGKIFEVWRETWGRLKGEVKIYSLFSEISNHVSKKTFLNRKLLHWIKCLEVSYFNSSYSAIIIKPSTF